MVLSKANARSKLPGQQGIILILNNQVHKLHKIITPSKTATQVSTTVATKLACSPNPTDTQSQMLLQQRQLLQTMQSIL